MYTLFQTKMAKSIPYFRLEMLQNDTLWGGTYLYGLYMGLHPPPPPPPPIEINILGQYKIIISSPCLDCPPSYISGVFAFSQGACFLSLLCALREKGINPRQEIYTIYHYLTILIREWCIYSRCFPVRLFYFRGGLQISVICTPEPVLDTDNLPQPACLWWYRSSNTQG